MARQGSSCPLITLPKGHAHPVWYDNSASEGHTSFALDYRQRSGGTWSGTTSLIASQYAAMFPSLAAAGSNVSVVWADAGAGNYDVLFERSTDNGATRGVSPGATPTPTSTATPTAAYASPTPTATHTPGLLGQAAAPTLTPSATPTGVSASSGMTKYYYPSTPGLLGQASLRTCFSETPIELGP